MNDAVLIRRAKTADSEAIARFNIALARETESLDLDFSTAAAGAAGLIENPRFGFYVVAEAEGKLVGSMMATYEWSDWRNGLYWWIQSVYVAPEFRRKGIYRRLHDFIRFEAKKDKQARGIRLYVEEQNLTAQETYLKVGMTKAPYRIFEELFT